MRVYFYTGSFTHTMYREQAGAVPEGVDIAGSSPELRGTGIKADLVGPGGNGSARRSLSAMVKDRVLRTIVAVGAPNIRYVRAPECDLIHSAQYPLLNRKPWVVDFEDASVFAWYDPASLRKWQVRRTLESLFARQACRAILPWTHAARESLLNALDCSAFASKIKVVYPAIAPVRPPRGRSPGAPLRLLFVGSAFYYKGGLETLLAFERIRQTMPAQLTMVTFAPPEIGQRFSGMQGVTFRSRVTPADLEHLYSEADVLVAPFHTDTLGFVILEAFARGIPCVVANQYAAPELVTEGVTGRLVDTTVSRFGPDRLPRVSVVGGGLKALMPELTHPPAEYVERLAGSIEALGDEVLRARMADAAFREVSSGKFSVGARRSALSSVYRA